MCVYVCIVWMPVHMSMTTWAYEQARVLSVLFYRFYHFLLFELGSFTQPGNRLAVSKPWWPITYHCHWAGLTGMHTFTLYFLCRYWNQNSTPPTSLASKCFPPLGHLSSPSIIPLKHILRGEKPSPQSCSYLKHCSLLFLSFTLFWMNWNFCIRLIYWNMNFKT